MEVFMSMSIIDHNVNIIALVKNKKNYGMCCAWAMQVSEDKLLCAIGPQSTTGQVLDVGDCVGFSNLRTDQVDIAMQLGDINKHSADTDKLAGISYHIDDGAILIDKAHAEIKCKVIDKFHLKGLESENLFYLQIIRVHENGGKSLRMSDLEFN